MEPMFKISLKWRYDPVIQAIISNCRAHDFHHFPNNFQWVYFSIKHLILLVVLRVSVRMSTLAFTFIWLCSRIWSHSSTGGESLFWIGWLSWSWSRLQSCTHCLPLQFGRNGYILHSFICEFSLWNNYSSSHSLALNQRYYLVECKGDYAFKIVVSPLVTIYILSPLVLLDSTSFLFSCCFRKTHGLLFIDSTCFHLLAFERRYEVELLGSGADIDWPFSSSILVPSIILNCSKLLIVLIRPC